MLIKSVRVCNLRPIHDATLECNELTSLVGANGAGKSTFLHALEWFFSSSSLSVTEDDFHNCNTDEDIVVSVSFCDLSEDACERFEKYVEGNQLTVDMVVSWAENKANITYHGYKLQNPDFASIRQADNKTQARQAYNILRDEHEAYNQLPSCRNYDEVIQAIEAWEVNNTEQCERARDDGQFFGYQQVGRGYLRDYIRLLMIPAVRDIADDAEEGRGSAITTLMDYVVRSSLKDNEEFQNFKLEAQRQYQEFLEPTQTPELQSLGDRLTDTLQVFAPNAGVDLTWRPLQPLNFPMPQAEVGLIEDNYRTSAERAGHGLQRAFILTLLQHLTAVRITDQIDEAPELNLPTLVLIVEEPELYQHPNRQRHFAKVLRNLTTNPNQNIASRFQVLIATHSPLMLDIEHFPEIRHVKKQLDPVSGVNASQICCASFEDVANKVAYAYGRNYTVQDLLAILPQIMTPHLHEGFFADVVVLVEGPSDRVAYLETARLMEREIEGNGISIIPCDGKSKLLNLAAVFNQLQIPLYLVWDRDRNGSVETERLLRFVNYVDNTGNPIEITDHLIETSFTCFTPDRETCMEDEYGRAVYNRILRDCENDLGVPLGDGRKKPVVVRELIRRAWQEDYISESMCESIEQIFALT